jgi:transposase-like protein
MPRTQAKPRKSLVVAFRRKVKERRDTMTEIARAFGVSRGRLYSWLDGEFASRPLAEKVAAYVEAA